MDEMAYIVTRDSVKAEQEINEECVALWEPWVELEFATGRSWDGIWVRKHGPDDAVAEYTPEQFKEQFLMDAPEPGGRFMIRTDCKWERVEE
jgi:hypothetical protein